MKLAIKLEIRELNRKLERLLELEPTQKNLNAYARIYSKIERLKGAAK